MAGVLCVALGGQAVDAVARMRRPATRGSVVIVAPPDGTRARSETVRVRLRVRDFTLEDQGGIHPARSGHGHVHIALDGVTSRMTSGTEVETCVPAGRHRLRVALAAEDHRPFRSEAADEIVVVGAPGVRCGTDAT